MSDCLESDGSVHVDGDANLRRVYVPQSDGGYHIVAELLSPEAATMFLAAYNSRLAPGATKAVSIDYQVAFEMARAAEYRQWKVEEANRPEFFTGPWPPKKPTEKQKPAARRASAKKPKVRTAK